MQTIISRDISVVQINFEWWQSLVHWLPCFPQILTVLLDPLKRLWSHLVQICKLNLEFVYMEHRIVHRRNRP